MSELRNKIGEEIQQSGPIPFARFMQLCLYTEDLGYYEKPLIVGKAGDFYTSVSIGSLFGELLASRFGAWLQNGPQKGEAQGQCQIVEAGAHDGQLARDILTALRIQSPDLFSKSEYWILEPSSPRRTLQQRNLCAFGEKVRWFDSFHALPEVQGIIFSNELLDAFPVHRISWNAASQNWQEFYVNNSSSFEWMVGDLSFPATEISIPKEILPHLPDGFQLEIGRAAAEWWQHAAAKLKRGKIIAFDYGYTIEEYLRSGKTGGTLRAYKDHRVSDDLLAHPGEQDLTAHVNFDQIRVAGEAAGLQTEDLLTQAQFLTPLFEQTFRASDKATLAKSIRPFQTLTSPEHLGRFKVLVQSR